MTWGPGFALSIVIVVVVFGAFALAWWRRTRRDADPLAPTGELPARSAVRAEYDALYVATTRHDEPLERLAAPGLGFRSRAHVVIADTGVTIDLNGAQRIVLTSDRLVEVGQSTVAIDRVVEADGLVRLVWRSLTDSVVDTYLRPSDVSAKALADAIRPLVPGAAPTPAPTGTDA